MTALVGAKEGSTFVVTATFKDEDGTAFTPVSAKWTLVDSAGAVVNSRSDVVLSSLTASVTIVLSGADLSYGTGGNFGRVMTLEGTYDSLAGSGLPFASEASFTVEPTPAAR